MMKSIYRSLFIVSTVLLTLGSLISFGVPPEESFASRLARTPEHWKIIFVSTDHLGFAKDPETAKKVLLEFLNNNENPTDMRVEYSGAGLFIISVFSLIGWIREHRIENRLTAEPLASDYRCPAGAPKSEP